jgi:hypothetical protein
MSKRDATCPSCGKPFKIEGVGATIPEHKINVVRGGKPVPVKCPGSGKNPN